MGLDGFTFSNVGITKELTSAQMASQSEQIASSNVEYKVKDVTNIADQKGIKRKEDDNAGNQTFNDGFYPRKRNDEENNDENKSKNLLFEQQLMENPKEFSVRININTEMVELYNNQSNKTIETISAQDLMDLISKVDSASGVLVNKKV